MTMPINGLAFFCSTGSEILIPLQLVEQVSAFQGLSLMGSPKALTGKRVRNGGSTVTAPIWLAQ